MFSGVSLDELVQCSLSEWGNLGVVCDSVEDYVTMALFQQESYDGLVFFQFLNGVQLFLLDVRFWSVSFLKDGVNTSLDSDPSIWFWLSFAKFDYRCGWDVNRDPVKPFSTRTPHHHWGTWKIVNQICSFNKLCSSLRNRRLPHVQQSSKTMLLLWWY